MEHIVELESVMKFIQYRLIFASWEGLIEKL